MAEDIERKIAERAYQIWDEEGRLLGRDKEHWAQARRDLGLSDDVDMPPVQPEQPKRKAVQPIKLKKNLWPTAS
jgi:hypothetical protein